MKQISRQDFPYTFDPDACRTCAGRCCAGESGNIWVDPPEISDIASLLGMNQVDFLQKYLNRVGNRLSLAERSLGTESVCVFFDDRQRRCTIYASRPGQCRSFPFWEYFKTRPDELRNECPGVILIGQDD